MDVPYDYRFAILIAAAFVAGGINGVAGGGTLFTFTALGMVFPLRVANATNSALLTPASISSALAFVSELKRHKWRLAALIAPTVLGSYTGAVTLINTSDELFRRVVPFLILFAVLLFAFKDRLLGWVNRLRGRGTDAPGAAETIPMIGWVWGVTFQFIVALYGGYFGAGIGILMISSFSLMGMRDMKTMNAIKNPLAFLINGVAALRFIVDGLVVWAYAIPLAVCAMIGGYLASRASRNINQTLLRRFVIVYGFVIAAYLFVRYWILQI
jgi:hypothetical protein